MSMSQHLKSKTLISRLKPFLRLERFRSGFVVDGGLAQFCTDAGTCSGSGQVEFCKWRKLDATSLGIPKSTLPSYSWIVLKNLRSAGFNTYLVGGCVRDLLLNKVPKDFDVITTATLEQVKRKFRYAIIIGKRFPICRVKVKGMIVEVSSFETAAKKSRRKEVSIPQRQTRLNSKDLVCWKDSKYRDFTINSLYFDPFRNAIFDFNNGVMDVKSLKLRTVIPAQTSFQEDQARILRGLRLAARLNLSLSKETEAAICSLSSLVADLCKSRINLEINYMLSYGAAEPSLLLLKRFKLLEILLPFQAAYLSEQEHNGLDQRSVMLMKLFFNLDLLITCDRPCDQSMWVAIMAFHMALFSNPQHIVVVLTFASLLYHQTWTESIEFARKNAKATQIYVPEVLDASHDLSDDEIAERVTRFAGQVAKSVDILTRIDCLIEAMTRFREIQPSNLVFVSVNMGSKVKDIFKILSKDVTSLEASNKRVVCINHNLLTAGKTHQVRFVLGKIILDSLLAIAKQDNMEMKNPHPELEVLDQNMNKRNLSSNNELPSESARLKTMFNDNSVITDDKFGRDKIPKGKLSSLF
ncbi:Polynucleotide adenylyltransferase family protein [Striga hermonthica]|uniref:Polynucleotide adenylyltransferase family protein n=1 Tax=Striga hermonthica TaxID=68872 RepID=A0A9N7N5V4_STRHE|nr:Polynucleotide adenylyltransferase family protein [Striga hermonthica]